MVNRLCRLKPSLTCKRPLTATGNSSNPAFMPTCHSPVGFLHCSGIFSVLPVSPTISRGPMPLHRALRTVEVSTSPLPEVSIKSTIFGRPSTVVLTCVKHAHVFTSFNLTIRRAYSYLEPCHSWVYPCVKYCNDDTPSVKFRIRCQEFFCSCFTLGDQAMEWKWFERGVHQTVVWILDNINYGQLIKNVNAPMRMRKVSFRGERLGL